MAVGTAALLATAAKPLLTQAAKAAGSRMLANTMIPAGRKGVGAGVAQAAPTLATYAAGRFSPEGAALTEESKRAAERLRKGEFGLTAAQKRGMLGEAVRGIQSATRGLETDLRRQAAAAGGFGRSGAQQAALGEVASQQGEAAAQASGRIEEMSTSEARRQRAETLNALREARQRRMIAAGDITQEMITAGIAGQKTYERERDDAASKGAAAVNAQTQRDAKASKA